MKDFSFVHIATMLFAILWPNLACYEKKYNHSKNCIYSDSVKVEFNNEDQYILFSPYIIDTTLDQQIACGNEPKCKYLINKKFNAFVNFCHYPKWPTSSNKRKIDNSFISLQEQRQFDREQITHLKKAFPVEPNVKELKNIKIHNLSRYLNGKGYTLYTSEDTLFWYSLDGVLEGEEVSITFRIFNSTLNEASSLDFIECTSYGLHKLNE